jgi:hypothetical protein
MCHDVMGLGEKGKRERERERKKKRSGKIRQGMLLSKNSFKTRWYQFNHESQAILGSDST